MKLHSQVIGSGPPVILMHGLFGSHQNWLPVARQLAGQFWVHTVDLRNHGASPHHDDVDYPLMADDLLSFMNREDISKASLLGHSLGGKVAMQFALLHADRVEKLVVVDIAPRAYEAAQQDVFDALRALDLTGLRTRTQADEALAAHIPHHAMRRFLLTNLVHKPEGGLRWRINLDALYAQREQLTVAINGMVPFEKPALFVRGGQSNYIREDDLTEIQAVFPFAKLATIDGAGHWVHVDALDAFLAAITDFLGG